MRRRKYGIFKLITFDLLPTDFKKVMEYTTF